MITGTNVSEMFHNAKRSSKRLKHSGMCCYRKTMVRQKSAFWHNPAVDYLFANSSTSLCWKKGVQVSHLPLVIQSDEKGVLPTAQTQEINQQQHAQRIVIRVQATHTHKHPMFTCWLTLCNKEQRAVPQDEFAVLQSRAWTSSLLQEHHVLVHR